MHVRAIIIPYFPLGSSGADTSLVSWYNYSPLSGEPITGQFGPHAAHFGTKYVTIYFLGSVPASIHGFVRVSVRVWSANF